jgi:broad specificity phosphatase PhoE
VDASTPLSQASKHCLETASGSSPVGQHVTVKIPSPSLYLARHGQTSWNVQRRRQGQLDSELTSNGRQQAQYLAALATAEGIDGIFASPLGRAAKTAEIVAAELGRSVILLDELAEIDHGQFAGLTNDQIRAKYAGALEARAESIYRWRFPGGESYADGDVRAGVALARIERTGHERALIVSHEMISRMLLRQLLDLTPENALTYDLPHDVVYKIDTSLPALTTLALRSRSV